MRPGSTAFANRPTENAEKTSIAFGRGGSIAEWITVVQASARAATESRFRPIATATHSHWTSRKAVPIAVKLPCLHQISAPSPPRMTAV
jgi:hypothetical protein